MTKREKYLIETFKISPAVVEQISEIGRLSGTHKFDVWIAKEIKKDIELLNNLDGFLFIIDWAKKTRPNISSYTFEVAHELSTTWHNSMVFDESVQNKEIEDDGNIIYRCLDKKHYFVLLKAEDLGQEGEIMKNCVGLYGAKVKSGASFIVSLRDENNKSHVTMEIDIRSKQVIQVKGKANTEPALKYLKLLTEFALMSSGYKGTMDKEILEVMELNFE
jgi:hypothetical protein